MKANDEISDKEIQKLIRKEKVGNCLIFALNMVADCLGVGRLNNIEMKEIRGGFGFQRQTFLLKILEHMELVKTQTFKDSWLGDVFDLLKDEKCYVIGFHVEKEDGKIIGHAFAMINGKRFDLAPRLTNLAVEGMFLIRYYIFKPRIN